MKLKRLLLILLLVGLCQLRSFAALTDNLISFWELEEASGTRVDRVVASANDLSDNNTVTQAAGKVGNAGQFTLANTEYLSHTDNASLSVGGTAFTFTAWVYFDSFPDAFPTILSKDDNDVNQEFWLFYYTTGTEFIWDTWTGASSAGKAEVVKVVSITTGTWHFVMVKSDQTLNYISVDDGTPATVSAVSAGWDGAAPFQIGHDVSQGTVGRFDGRIDQVGFWKRALSAAEITQLYNSGNGMSYADMVGTTGKVLPLMSRRRR